MLPVDCISPSTADLGHRPTMDTDTDTTQTTSAPNDPCPRLRPGTPIIRRNERLVHFGDDPHPTEVSESEAAWLHALSTFHSWTEALAAAPSCASRGQQLIDEAARRGALDDARECWWLSPVERLDIASSLAALSSWHHDPPAAIASRMASSVAVVGDEQWASVVRDSLGTSGLHYSDDASSADVTIVCASLPADAPEAVLTTTPLQFQDRRHLPITAFRGRASIGPLIEPGFTACLRCAYLHHRDADSAWPTMMTQWLQYHANHSLPPDPLLALHCAVHAATMIRAWVDAPGVQTPRRVVIRSPEFSAQERSVLPHPACGCLWGAADTGPAIPPRRIPSERTAARRIDRPR